MQSYKINVNKYAFILNDFCISFNIDFDRITDF